MKYILSLLMFFLGLNTLSAQATIELHIGNVDVGNGPVMVALYDSETSYMKVEKDVSMIKSEKSELIVRFENLSEGEYAITIFQDENEDKELNVGMFGPKEPYAFSNNAKGSFGPAKFKDAKFLVEKDKVTIHKISFK